MEELQLMRDALADRVIGAVVSAFQKLAEHREDIETLWREFESLKPGETIKGCRTKTEFAETHLRRSIRSVQYMLKGGNFNRGETVSLPTVEIEAVTPEEDPLYNEGKLSYSDWTKLIEQVLTLEGRHLKGLACSHGVSVESLVENFKAYANSPAIVDSYSDDNWVPSLRIVVAARNMLDENPELCTLPDCKHRDAEATLAPQ